MRTLGTVASLKWAFRGSSAATAWAALLDSLQTEDNGMVLDFEDPDYPRALIRDTTTPANSKDVDANSVLTYTSPALKNVMGADGTIKYANHNLCLQSQTFDAVGWTRTNVTLTADAIAAPDGTTTADKVEAASATNITFSQTISFAGSASGLTAMMRIKQGSGATEANRFRVRNGTTATDLVRGTFNYSTLEITYTIGSTGMTLTDIGDGWLLLKYESSTGWSDNDQIIFYVGFDGTAEGAGEFFYGWGCHVAKLPVHNDGTLADYVPTTTAARYRLPIEYDTAGDPVGLLDEEARTNLTIYSNSTATGWTKNNCSASENTTDVLDPFGTNTASKITKTTGTNTHDVESSTSSVSLVASSTYTISRYFYNGDARYVWLCLAGTTATSYFRVTADLQTGTITQGVAGGAGTYTSSSIVDVGDGWYRLTATGVCGSDTAAYHIFGCASTGTPTQASYGLVGSFAGTPYFYTVGGQVEAGPFPTSYIRTTSATVTRAADNISLATSAFPYSATAGSLIASARTAPGLSTTTQYIASLTDGTTNEMHIFYRLVSGSTRAVGYQIVDNVSIQCVLEGVSTVADSTNFKFGASWAANDFAASLDGATAVTDISGTLPTVTTLYVGNRQGNDRLWNGHIKYIKYLPRAVSDANLISETAA